MDKTLSLLYNSIMTTPWQEWKKKNAERQQTGVVRPWDFFNPDTEYADQPLALERWNICAECPKLQKATGTCSECGCFMKLKVKLQEATCPLDKWTVKP